MHFSSLLYAFKSFPDSYKIDPSSNKVSEIYIESYPYYLERICKHFSTID